MPSEKIHARIADLLKRYIPKIRGHACSSKNLSLRPCAVLVPLIKGNAGDEEVLLLITRRSVSLNRNPGQYAFPGGMLEEQDRGEPCTCALREWHEEMGASQPNSILGLLDNFWTISGLAITPVVGWFENRPVLEISQHEVQEVFYVPLSFFSRNNLKREIIKRKDVSFESDTYYWEGKRIWGATAGIITNLVEVLGNLND